MSKTVKKACVTGGAGFIGSQVVRNLLARDIDVVVIDNLSVGRRENVPAAATLVEADILDSAVMDDIAGCDAVFHLAARVAIRSSFEFVVEDTTANVVGTANVLRGATRADSRVRKFILASSMAVYADSPQPTPISEDYTLQPVSPYGVSKLAAEMLVRQMCDQSGIDSAVLRLFNTYGRGQALSPYVGVATIFANAMREGRAPSIFGDGEQRRDFIHVEDVAQGFINAMLHPTEGKVFNIGSGQALTVNQVYSAIAQALNFDQPPVYAEAVPGELRNSIADNSRARQTIEFNPKHVFADTIAGVLEGVGGS
ncbi:MAG: NAD-dependent epimerase/dehydratase family protein [Halioglobus sp.]|nr:NAD-dependent epimerase/dehydratase family protein [Halioglobus sp.]